MSHVHETDDRRLDDFLARSGLTPTAAEAHGILCGLLCANHPRAAEAWIDELLAETDPGDPLTPEVHAGLVRIAERTEGELAQAATVPIPWLADDETPVADRAYALYEWSRGFLFGLGLAGLDQGRLAGVVGEVLRDFAAITQLDLDHIDETEADEESVTELSEFARAAAMLVYEELHPARAALSGANA